MARALPLVFTLACAAAAAAAVPARAQQAPAEPPQRAPAPLAPDPIDAGFAQWSAGRVASPASSTPRLVQGGRFEVLVMTPSARRAMHAENALVPVVNRCAAGAALEESARSEVTGIDPWAGFEAAASALSLVAVSVIPSHGQATICGVPDEERFAAMARGVRFGRKPRYEATNDARTVELRIDGRAVAPVIAGRVPVSEVARGTAGRDGTMQVRLYVPPEAFAPGARGQTPSAELIVWNAADSVPDRIRIDPSIVRLVWDDALRWRARRAQLVDAERALDDLTAPGLSASARRSALLRSTDAFARAGDAAAARGLASRLLESDPCLTLSTGVDASTRAALESARPPARCTSVPLRTVALRALVPGFGQVTGDRRIGTAVVAAGTVALAFVSASSSHASARDRYARYQAMTGFETDPTTAEQMFDDAESMRVRGNQSIVIGAAIWVLAGLEAVYREQRHREAIADVREYDRKAPWRVGFIPAPRGLGLGFSIEVLR